MEATHSTLNIRLKRLNPNKDNIVAIELKNTGPTDVRWLTWCLPSNGEVTTNLFSVIDGGGNALAYIGPFVSYGEPKDTDYVLLKSGDRFWTQVDLAKYYKLKQGATYHVSIHGLIEYFTGMFTDKNKPEDFIEFKSEEVTFVAY